MTAFEYKIVDGTIESVEEHVNALAENGWVLAGPIQVRNLAGYGPYYTQTMTRIKAKKKNTAGAK